MSNIVSIDTSDLVSSKENIQPLRGGRDTSILCTALQAETDIDAQQELEKQRNEFEIKLRSNTSNDPLSDWCNYIHWIEQSFPKRAKEGKLNIVLQKCINKFKDCEQYMNDIRFVKLCIKYADLEENSVELLSQIHRHGIGVGCAELYVAWAEKYVVDNCFKKANAIYERGLHCSAQPVTLLEEAYQNFQAFLVRKMLNDRETFQPTLLDPNTREMRQPYNVLQSYNMGQKEIIPSVRTGSNVLGAVGKLQKVCQKEQKPKSNKLIKIFEDSEDNMATAEPKAKLEKVLSKKILTKENTVKPGPWNNKKNRHAAFTVDAPSSLPFQVHRDEYNDEGNDRKEKAVPASVLKSHKLKSGYEDDNFATAPLFYPEPYDPMKLSMYCKEQVYAGGLEFQFEELRAIQYRRKREELYLTSKKTCKAVTCESKPINSPDVIHQPINIKHACQTKPKSEKNKFKLKEKSSSETKSKILSTHATPICTSEQDNLANTDYSMNQTIHTKEALSEMQQLWFSKPASPVPLVKPAKPVAKSILKTSKPCFSLYVDESCLENFKSPQSEDKPLDLTFKIEKSYNENKDPEKVVSEVPELFCVTGTENLNPTVSIKKKKALADNIIQSSSCDKENLYITENVELIKEIPKLQLDDENKENGIPDDYCGPVGKSNRKVSGILTPAENIEIAPLSDEEVEVYDEEDEAQGQDLSSIIQCNTTAITETWNFTKGFQFPRGESTPNMRKSIHNRVDSNESVFMSEIKSNETRTKNSSKQSGSGGEINTVNVAQTNEKKVNGETENFNKNLSVIAETSREYRSSSSGSSGISTLRTSKNFRNTPSGNRSSKISLISSHNILQKTKVQSSGYETSTEFSQTALKTPMTTRENLPNTTFDLIKKLNAMEDTSSCAFSKDEDDMNLVNNKMKTLEVHEKNEEPVNIDPFSDEIIERLLQKVDFPNTVHVNGYFLLYNTDIPFIKVGSSITLGAFNFEVKKVLGEGSYARIFRLVNSTNGEHMIAKFQKPAFPWEFYITREVQFRIANKDLAAMFMDVESAFFFKSSSVLLTRPVEYGDLLQVINKIKQAKLMCQTLAMHFTCQILKILETLHSCQIIHGDLKPDNFLVRKCNDKLQLQLIDFGRSIDMTLFPKGTKFTKVVTTESFTTVEMQTGKPWTYQIDLYGAANCGHCLLFGDYMKIIERDGIWNIVKVIPRYWAKTEWKNFFISLLNVESCEKLPDLSELRKSFEAVLADDSEFEFSLFKINNLLNDR